MNDMHDSGKYTRMPSGYVHQWRTRDGVMTGDRQLGLLIHAAHAAYRAWGHWNSLAIPTVQGKSPDLDEAMRFLYREVQSAEVFLSGLAGSYPEGE